LLSSPYLFKNRISQKIKVPNPLKNLVLDLKPDSPNMLDRKCMKICSGKLGMDHQPFTWFFLSLTGSGAASANIPRYSKGSFSKSSAL